MYNRIIRYYKYFYSNAQTNFRFSCKSNNDDIKQNMICVNGLTINIMNNSLLMAS